MTKIKNHKAINTNKKTTTITIIMIIITNNFNMNSPLSDCIHLL